MDGARHINLEQKLRSHNNNDLQNFWRESNESVCWAHYSKSHQLGLDQISSASLALFQDFFIEIFFAKVRRRWSIAYHVKDSQDEKEVVKNAVNPLSPKGPNGDSIAKKTDNTHDENQQTFCHPLKIIHFSCFFSDREEEVSLGTFQTILHTCHHKVCG